MYRAGEIYESEIGLGWYIEILDPQGDLLCDLYYAAEPVEDDTGIEHVLKMKAETLLSHLNRG